ncbi:uncharacterized protein LOC105739894 [Nomascus leucogenys]|uniref:uncharacterized protein LOC105739894 n=1 Tax=Nomascus leucogenys TaxID=61853 RepID=UPI00122D9CF0|nr:uncharacterized protein LOC105739894 [Nomascus leucogenys]
MSPSLLFPSLPITHTHTPCFQLSFAQMRVSPSLFIPSSLLHLALPVHLFNPSPSLTCTNTPEERQCPRLPAPALHSQVFLVSFPALTPKRCTQVRRGTATVGGMAILQVTAGHPLATAQGPVGHLLAMVQGPADHPQAMAQGPVGHLLAMVQGPAGLPLAMAQGTHPLVHITEEVEENRTQDGKPERIAQLTWNEA